MGLHQVGAGVHGGQVQFGAHLLVPAGTGEHRGECGGLGVRKCEGELPVHLPTARPAAASVWVMAQRSRAAGAGVLQLQMVDQVRAGGPTGRQQAVQGSELGEAFQVPTGGPGAVAHIGQGGVGLAGHQTLDLGSTQPGHAGEGHPHAPPALAAVGKLWMRGHPLQTEAVRGGVHIHREHRDAHAAGLGDHQPPGIHAGVVLEDPGQERLRMVGLEPGGVVGGHGERGAVGLAEAEGAEGVQGPPDLVDHLQRVAAGQGLAPEEGLHDLLPRTADLPAELVGPGQPTPGHHIEHAQHLLVEDGHPMGLGQHRRQVRVGVAGHPPAVALLQEGADHVRLHGARAEQGDVDDQIVELHRGHLPDQLALSRRLDLEAAQGVGGADHLVGGRVIQGHLLQVHGLPRGPFDLLQGVGDGGLHPHSEHVQFEHAHGVHVVFVELAHGQPDSRGLDGSAVQQGGIPQDHSAGVHGDVPGQPVQALGQVHQQVQLLLSLSAPGLHAVGEATQLRHPVHGLAEAGRGEAPHLLGDPVHLVRFHPQSQPGIPDRSAHPVPVLHAHQGGALGPEPLEHGPVDLVPAG